nr:hypothetical protein [Cyanobacteria bacterium RUI128]
TNIILGQTIKDKIPTVVFLSDISISDLTKDVFGKLTKHESFTMESLTPKELLQVAEIMMSLTEIPLIMKEVKDFECTKKQISEFVKELGENKGIIILNCNQYNSETLPKCTGNISIILI